MKVEGRRKTLESTRTVTNPEMQVILSNASGQEECTMTFAQLPNVTASDGMPTVDHICNKPRFFAARVSRSSASPTGAASGPSQPYQAWTTGPFPRLHAPLPFFPLRPLTSLFLWSPRLRSSSNQLIISSLPELWHRFSALGRLLRRTERTNLGFHLAQG